MRIKYECSFIQYENPRIIWNTEVILMNWFDTGVGFKNPKVVYYDPSYLRWLGHKPIESQALRWMDGWMDERYIRMGWSPLFGVGHMFAKTIKEEGEDTDSYVELDNY